MCGFFKISHQYACIQTQMVFAYVCSSANIMDFVSAEDRGIREYMNDFQYFSSIAFTIANRSRCSWTYQHSYACDGYANGWHRCHITAWHSNESFGKPFAMCSRFCDCFCAIRWRRVCAVIIPTICRVAWLKPMEKHFSSSLISGNYRVSLDRNAHFALRNSNRRYVGSPMAIAWHGI